MATLTRGIPLSKISPKFLHSNATSHTGPFSAVAELIDNAYDPDVSADELRIDKCVIHGKPCLVFQDDGAGMDYERLLKMLSFGYCDKTAFENNTNHLPIGHYGNGFKSGSMRLGKDALVFTVCKKSASVGFLSQTYLEAIGADCVFVPMIEYRLPHLERIKSQESRNNLEAIMKHSPFRTEQDLKAELQTLCKGRKQMGTKIVIYNLRRLKDGKMELDFESDSTDIRNPEAHEVDLTSVYHRTTQVETSEYMRSLRVYCSILFLRPRMKIYIRDVKVKTQIISKSLSKTETDVYKPTWLSKPLRITFGFSTQDPVKEDYGVMFYHRNRLIKAYEKLGFQKQPNDLGIGVVGVVQVDVLKPIHNKQDFEKDEKYNAIMSSIGFKLNDYWNEKKNGTASTSASGPAPQNLPDWLWVQCERCLKWRRLPDSVRSAPLPDVWVCYMNPDPTHNRCEIPEEPEDEDEAVSRASYSKTYKRKAEEKKRLRQADIAAKEAELKAREKALLEAQKQQEMPTEVSSSEQNHDIAQLQRALLEARKREEDHKRLIVKIQYQKKQVEDQHNSLIEAARNLRTSQTTTSELLDVASVLAGENPDSSTSTPPVERGQKRRSSSEGVPKKVMNLTTEQGDMLTIERAYSDEDDDGEAPDRLDFPVADDPPTTPPTGTEPRTSTPATGAKQSTSIPDNVAKQSTSIPDIVAKQSTSIPDNVAKQSTSTPGTSAKQPASTPKQPAPTSSKSAKQPSSASGTTSTSTPKKTTKQPMSAPGTSSKHHPPTPKLPGSSSKSSPRRPRSRTSSAANGSTASVGVIDLTLEEEGLQTNGTTTTNTTANTELSDVKPDVNQLQQAMKQADRGDKANGEKEGGAKGGGEGSRDTEVKVEDDGRFAHLQHKHKLLTRRFRNLQRNVHKLLSFIVPDVDLGPEEDIEHIVTEMIRVNCNQNQNQAS